MLQCSHYAQLRYAECRKLTVVARVEYECPHLAIIMLCQSVELRNSEYRHAECRGADEQARKAPYNICHLSIKY